VVILYLWPKLKEQKLQGRYQRSEHTITYYQKNTNLLTGIHATNVANNEDAFEKTTAVSATESTTTEGNAPFVEWTFTTASDEPNIASWPSGTYRCQLNVTAAGAAKTYGLKTQSGAAGHFARVDSTLTSELETVEQAESIFSGTGLKLATASWTPTAGAASDRFEVAVSGTGTTKGQSITLTLNTTDSYADGPWTVGGGVTGPGHEYIIITS